MVKYTYNPGRPNAVASITKVGGGSASFSYDANGNMISGDGKTLTYTAFNMPSSVTAGGVTASFYYGSDLSRYKQSQSNGETTFYLDKMMEIVTVGSTTDYRHYLSDVAVLTKIGDLNGSIAGGKLLPPGSIGESCDDYRCRWIGCAGERLRSVRQTERWGLGGSNAVHVE